MDKFLVRRTQSTTIKDYFCKNKSLIQEDTAKIAEVDENKLIVPLQSFDTSLTENLPLGGPISINQSITIPHTRPYVPNESRKCVVKEVNESIMNPMNPMNPMKYNEFNYSPRAVRNRSGPTQYSLYNPVARIEYYDRKLPVVKRRIEKQYKELLHIISSSGHHEFYLKSEQTNDYFITSGCTLDIEDNDVSKVLIYTVKEYNCKIHLSNITSEEFNKYFEFLQFYSTDNVSNLENSPDKENRDGNVNDENRYNTPTKVKPLSYSPSIKKSKANGTTPTKLTYLPQSALKPNNNPGVSISSQIIKACLAGHNVFISGGGGTGKTTLLQGILKLLYNRHGKDSVFATATTGLAACAIGGITVHQFAGIGGVDESTNIDAVTTEVSSKPILTKRWRQTKVLIIDEVSMLHPKVFEIIHNIAVKIRSGNVEPFGGIQIILCGDFYQLPPVSRPSSINYSQCNKPPTKDSPKYCFQSALWKESMTHSFVLTKVHRQNDIDFIDCLESLKKGIVTEAIQVQLNSCVGKSLDCKDGILPTQLFTHRQDVDIINYRELSSLPGEIYTFNSIDSGDEVFKKMLNGNITTKACIKLKIGAQVILTKTLSIKDGLVNGSRGVVTKFTRDTKSPVVRFTNGIEKSIYHETFTLSIGGKSLAERIQIPLDLAWGMSVHKSQGMSIDKAVIDLRKVFECGQAYVALSRVKNLEGLSLVSPILAHQILCDNNVIEFYNELENTTY